jgi:GNAT superfamily N-acetyltransferase
MKHDLRNVSATGDTTLLFRTFSEMGDADVIVNLQNKIFLGTSMRPLTKEETVFWVKNLGLECFVVFLGLEAVASAFCEVRKEKNETHGWIFGFGVLPLHRREKIGTTLLIHILNYFKSKGACSVFLDADFSGYQQRFYESNGFQAVGKYMCLEKEF